MQFVRFPRFVTSGFESAVFAAIGGMPTPKEQTKAKRPYERARQITKKASAQCAAVSGSLSMPVGPLGMLTILPDLVFVWKIQAQMVVDIAAAFGHKKKVTQQELLTCLMQHVADNASREYEKSIPLEHEKPKSNLLLELIDRASAPKGASLPVPISKQLGRMVLRRTVHRVTSRLLPLAGAAVVATYSAIDTRQVARTAVELFSGEKLPARHKQDFPRAEEMFEAPGMKEIDPDAL
ncbi:MAG: hypothetical protein R3194_14785 [Limnobacter sp.]|nr:hypothetical protein [Limnobacter sp.]